MPKDFKASQIRTSALVGSGTQGGKPGILVYSASDASNFEGSYQTDMLTNVGTDVFFFVSGSKNSRTGISLFGGDVVVSGTLYMERLIAEVDLSTTSSSAISGSLFVSQSATIGGGLIVNNADDGLSNSAFTVIGSEQSKHLIHADPLRGEVFILSGGAPGSNDQTTATDTSFFVSGTIGSKNSTVKGTSVFGGDVVISGSLTDGDGKPIVGGASGDTVGWFSGSSATHGSLGIQPDFISTSGSLAVSGSALDIAANIRQIGDTANYMQFGTDSLSFVLTDTQFIIDDANDRISVGNAANESGTSTAEIIVQSGDPKKFLVHAKPTSGNQQVLILSGGAPGSYDESSGVDVAFYVSGSRVSAGTSTRGTAVLGGDTVISGALYVGSTEQDYLYVKKRIVHDGDDNTYISLVNDGIYNIASGSIFTFAQGNGDKHYTVNAFSTDIDFIVRSAESSKYLINAIAESGNQQVMILSGGAPGSVDEASGSDVAFYVSGTVGSSGTSTRGTALFGGDVVVSGSESVEGDLNVAEYIRHIGDDDTAVHFLNDKIRLQVGTRKAVKVNTDSVIILSGGQSSNDESSAADVAFYVSGSVGSRGQSIKGTSLFGGDLAISGSVYGTKTRSGGISGHNKELEMVADVFTFGRTTSETLGNEVFFFVSGASPVGAGAAPSVALFDGRLVTSGNINVVQNYPATGSLLLLNNMSTVSGDGGSVRIDMVAGESSETADNSLFQIAKFGPANPAMNGGPWANVFFAKSGSLVFMVGGEGYSGNQPIVFRDSGGTFFMSTTGSAQTGDASIYFLSGGAGSSPNLVGRDINFAVSGAIGSAGGPGVNVGTAVFGGDLVVSGALQVKNGSNSGGSISGSIHHTSDGKSYLIAGDNVTITSASDGSITIGATGGGGGSSTFKSGSTSISSVSTIDVTRLGLLTNLGSGEIAITGTIGPSEDGTYSDGLFTSFNSDTEIGHAIDKINEVLFYLSPSPAPNLSSIGNDGLAGLGGTGELGDDVGQVRLSIGTDNIGGSSYTVVGGTAGISQARGRNDSYHIVTSSNNIRMGVFTSLPTITGHLADGVAQNAYVGGVINHSGSAFGDADQGTLKLLINGTVRHTVDLSLESVGAGDPGSGTDSQVDGNNNGFFNLSQTGSAVQANGQPFGLFKYRTGKVRIGTNFQRTGWNYAQVVHTVNSIDRSTNQFEWFVDTAGTNPNVNAVKLQNVSLSGSKYISGIQYATGAEGRYVARIDNFYDHVYALNNITFTTTNVDAIPAQTVPSVPAYADSYNAKILLSSSFQLAESSINAGTMVSGTMSYNFSLAHPTKNNMTNTGSIASDAFLVYSASSLANDQFEDFVYETKRITSGSYTLQSDVTAAGATWDSTLHLTSSTSDGHAAGHEDGLAFFAGQLKSPSKTTAQGGDFTVFLSGTDIDGNPSTNHFALRPERQPNYSTGGGATGTKTFFRAFRNESGASVNNFKLSLTGSSTTIVHTGSSLDTGNIRVFVKNPQSTGYLDLGQRFKDIHQTGQFQVNDYDGLHIGTFTSAMGGSPTTISNVGSFGTGSVPNNGYIVLKVEADASWNGNLEGMNVEFPGFSSANIVAAPALDELDITTPGDFVAGKLSFGVGNDGDGDAGGGPANYISVTGSSGNFGYQADVDFNGDYTIATPTANNKRYGINSSNGSVEDVIGVLNPDVTAAAGAQAGSYTADAFRYGGGGVLSLYVNQSGSGVTPVHSVNLATFMGAGSAGAGSATSVNANGSGFIDLSLPTPASSSTGLPDFSHFFRTAKFKVAGADQNAKGWNWAQVVHSFSGLAPDEVTTFVEWVNDDDGNAVDISSFESGSFNANGFYYQSGVKYFNTSLSPVATGTVKYRVSDAYTNVYSNSPTALQLSTLTNFTAQGIFVTGSAVVDSGDTSLTSNGTGLPDLVAGGDITSDIHVTGTLTYTGGTSLPGDASPLSGFTTISPVATLTVDHPIDSSATQAVTFSNFLAYSGSAGSSNINTTEKFTGEFYRMRSGSFANQAASGSLKWDATQSLVGADAAHNTGLLVYGNDGSNGYLVSPKSSALPNSGDFRSYNDLNSPPSNVDYSGASGERHFFRTFKNNTTSDQAVVTIVIKGDATLVPRTGAGSGTLGANKNVFVFAKIPGKTGWLDIAKAADGTITDGGGGLQGDRDATIDSSGASNELTFSTAFVGGDPSSDGSGEHFCLAIHADSNWTGYIKEILVTF